jgi:predicted ATPase
VFLTIKGIGKIQDSTIEMKGITVIAGVNNTGKSTFGKALYCMFNAFYNAEKAIHSERVHDIRRIFRNIMRRSPFRIKKKKNIDDILTGLDLRRKIDEIITANIPGENKPDENTINILQENIENSVSITDIDIQNMIITRYFRQEFAGKINHIARPDQQAQIILAIKEKKIEIKFSSNECMTFDDEVGLLHNAIYIDTPFIMDNIKNANSDIFFDYNNSLSHRDKLRE